MVGWLVEMLSFVNVKREGEERRKRKLIRNKGSKEAGGGRIRKNPVQD
jgi:hypothetical protein